mgnify:CR=1 FL=1
MSADEHRPWWELAQDGAPIEAVVEAYTENRIRRAEQNIRLRRCVNRTTPIRTNRYRWPATPWRFSCLELVYSARCANSTRLIMFESDLRGLRCPYCCTVHPLDEPDQQID